MINSHLTSVAYPILEAHGELRESRLRIVPAADGNIMPAEPDPSAARK
jgi:phosphate:Na+ symporter